MQNKDLTFVRVRDGIANLFNVPADRIKPESSYEELGMDSLDNMELIFHCEDEFNLSLDDRLLDGVTTVGGIVEVIDREIAKGSSRG